MTDNKDLIAEARNSFKATNASANLIHRLADALEATLWERDAALAAVERVRGIHVEDHKDCCGGKGRCRSCYEVYPCPTVAALDGAPEPEAKP